MKQLKEHQQKVAEEKKRIADQVRALYVWWVWSVVYMVTR